jgi:hypothetical protein
MAELHLVRSHKELQQNIESKLMLSDFLYYGRIINKQELLIARDRKNRLMKTVVFKNLISK